MKTIQAIETKYEGIRYRSRNEARWGVFFSCLGLDFEYEPEGYEIIHNHKKIRYAPDFFIRKQHEFDQDLYVEIKPSSEGKIIITKDDEEKVSAFGRHRPITILGSINDYMKEINYLGGTNYEYMYPYNKKYFPFTEDHTDASGNEMDIICDYGYLFCQCLHCGCFGFQYLGRAERIKCCEENNDHKDYNYDSKMILSALQDAAYYRFWK
jgi:hypothetical protein